MSEDDKYVMAMDFTGKTLLWIVSTGQLVDVCNVVDDEVPVFPTMHSLKNFLLSHQRDNFKKQHLINGVLKLFFIVTFEGKVSGCKFDT